MASLFSKPSMPKPTPPPTSADAQAAAAAQRAAAAAAGGRGATILTSGLGDTSEPTVERKELLGV